MLPVGKFMLLLKILQPLYLNTFEDDNTHI